MTTPKTKPVKQDPVKDVGAPYSLITSLLIGFPFLAIVAAMDMRDGTTDNCTSITGIIILMLGLTLCFYWRRLNHRFIKSFFAFAFIVNQWLFMICTTVARIIHADSVGSAAYKGVMILSLAASALIAVIFVVAWIFDSPRHYRFQAMSMSLASAMLVGIIAFRSLHVVEMVPGKEFMLSAHSAIADISKNVSIPSEIKALEAKILPADAMARLTAEKPATPEEKTDHAEDAAWGYDGDRGPESWGKLTDSFAACTAGTRQSPIDLTRSMHEAKHLKAAYHEAPMHIIDNGHTIQLRYDAGSQIKIGSDTYTLKGVQIHSPSEHTINGVVYPMEVQLIHADAKNRLAILSVLVEKGASHSELEKIFAFMPKGKKKEENPHGIMVDAMKLLPRDKRTFQYSGSLTTPPCTEGVVWNIFKQPIELSEQQIKSFRVRYTNNARPVQSMNGREAVDTAH